ncbi:MAG: GTP 3',8-cyclase MoaA [Aminipila sp.]
MNLIIERLFMIDGYKRNIDYIRISVTDRCNLRCIYCMPEEGVKRLPHVDILTYEEIVRLCKCFAQLGISKIKITGGEPLIRKDITLLIEQIKRLDGIKSVTLTTNGVNLKEQLPNLVKAGLDGVNISLDTLNPINYEKITRKDVLQQVLDSVEASLQYERLGIKINCVPMEQTDNLDIINIAGLAKQSRINVRFIEMMPIGLGKDYSYYSQDKIIEVLEGAYGHLELTKTVLGNGPAHYYSLKGFEGKIGFISALSHPFCGECNRVRLTSDGFLKTCLHYTKGMDLRTILRGNIEDSILEQLIKQAIYDKPISHNFKENNQKDIFERSQMSQIGG